MDQTASQSDFLVWVDGIPDYFATFSGGDVQASVSQVWNGGERTAEQIAGRPATSNITVDRPFKPQRDQPIQQALQKLVGSWRTTVTKRPLDADDNPVGDPDVYPDALLVRINPPDYDASSNRESRFTLEFAVSGIAA